MHSAERTSIKSLDYLGTEEEQALYRQLAVWCIHGARFGMHECADILYEAWQQTVRDHDRWKCEQHYLIAKAHGGKPEWGIERMSALLADDPDDDLAKVAIGLARLLGGLDDWQRPIDEVLATSCDQYARRTALRTISEVAPSRTEAWMLATLRPS
jgi:hypothetical protein